MDIFQSTILGTVQGLTEFLPVSSSGHLTLGQAIFGFSEQDIFFDIIVHLGTLFAILLCFKNDIKSLLVEALEPRTPGTSWFDFENWKENRGRYMILLVFLGTIPTVIIGLTGKDFFHSIFNSLSTVGYMFFTTSLILFSTMFTQKRATLKLTLFAAVLIGISQGFAILPGISRSGTTIAAALALKINREDAARFSFFLSIPAILGALLLMLKDINFEHLEFLPLVVGFISSFIVGFISLKLLLSLVKKGHLFWFAFWCILAGVVSLALS